VQLANQNFSSASQTHNRIFSSEPDGTAAWLVAATSTLRRLGGIPLLNKIGSTKAGWRYTQDPELKTIAGHWPLFITYNGHQNLITSVKMANQNLITIVLKFTVGQSKFQPKAKPLFSLNWSGDLSLKVVSMAVIWAES
jgi:hypothetical protein